MSRLQQQHCLVLLPHAVLQIPMPPLFKLHHHHHQQQQQLW